MHVTERKSKKEVKCRQERPAAARRAFALMIHLLGTLGHPEAREEAERKVKQVPWAVTAIVIRSRTTEAGLLASSP